MNKLIVPAVIVALGLIGGAALSQQAPPPASGFQAKAYFQMPLEKDPSGVVRLQSVVIPPGASNHFHRHPGDQWWAVQEGAFTWETVRDRLRTPISRVRGAHSHPTGMETNRSKLCRRVV